MLDSLITTWLSIELPSTLRSSLIASRLDITDQIAPVFVRDLPGAMEPSSSDAQFAGWINTMVRARPTFDAGTSASK